MFNTPFNCYSMHDVSAKSRVKLYGVLVDKLCQRIFASIARLTKNDNVTCASTQDRVTPWHYDKRAFT